MLCARELVAVSDSRHKAPSIQTGRSKVGRSWTFHSLTQASGLCVKARCCHVGSRWEHSSNRSGILMNSRWTSQQPGGAGSSEPSEGFIPSVTVGCAEPMEEPQYFSFWFQIGAFFFFWPEFYRSFLQGNFSDKSKTIMGKGRKTKKSWGEQGLGRRPQGSQEQFD